MSERIEENKFYQIDENVPEGIIMLGKRILSFLKEVDTDNYVITGAHRAPCEQDPPRVAGSRRK